MTSTAVAASNTIMNPFARGTQVVIPAGTPMRSTHPQRDGVYYSKRKQTITVHHQNDGWVDTSNYQGHGRGFVVLPQVTYPGTGGYWVDIKVTPELCKSNGAEVPSIPTNLLRETHSLDVVPAYGVGYDNRDA